MERLNIYLGVGMLLQADAKALEWVCASYLSQDKTAYEEIMYELQTILNDPSL